MPDRLKSSLFKASGLIILFLVLNPGNFSLLTAQEIEAPSDIVRVDSIVREPAPDTSSRDPRKAALYSAMLPGLGQFYNERYWKIPIVYAGFGTFIYFIDRNSRYYKDLKQKLMDPDYEMKYFQGDFTEDQLTRGKDLYKRWRDMSIIGTAGFYVFQIIDATVDAYLFNWDVGEDISFRVEPSNAPPLNPLYPLNSFGLSACISF